MAKILVWLKEPGGKAKHVHVSVRAENLEKLVDGTVEETTLATDLHILFNADMVFSNLKYNCTIAGQMFFGTIILIGKDGETFTDCPMDKNDIRKYLPQLMQEG